MLTAIITKTALMVVHGLSCQLSQFLVANGGPVLFLVVFADQIGLPLPSAPWLLAAGALSAQGQMNAGLVIGVSFIACLMLYFIAGFVFHNQVQGLVAALNGVAIIVMALVLALGSAYLAFTCMRRWLVFCGRRRDNTTSKRQEL